MADILQFSTWQDVETVVRKFEAREYAPSEFTHAHHLAVAAFYLAQSSREQSLDRMRGSLLRFTAHHNVKAYHETITRFWIELVASALDDSPSQDRVEALNHLLRQHGNKQEIFDYYSRERLQSLEARERWVEPDLRCLPSRTHAAKTGDMHSEVFRLDG